MSFYLIWVSINWSVPCRHILHDLLLAWQTLQSRSTLSLSFCYSLSSFFQLSNFYFLHFIFFSLSLLVCWLESLNNYSNILFFSFLPSMSDTLVLPSTWFSPKSARHCKLSHGFEAKKGVSSTSRFSFLTSNIKCFKPAHTRKWNMCQQAWRCGNYLQGRLVNCYSC